MPETARVCGSLSGAGGVVTQHRRQLDLGAAGPLSEKQRAAIEGALEADVCRALGLPAGSVEDARIGADGAVTFGVRHRASLSADAVDKALEASGMPETARVCGSLSGAGGVVTQHRRQLNLGAAGPLSEKQRAAIEGALEADVCRALGLPAGSVEDARIGADGAVTFGVRHRASLGADAVDKALEASGMPETARVCGSLSGAGGVVTQHRRQLNLGAAGPLSEKQRAAIEGALEADVCRALGLPAGSVEDARIGADGAVTFGVRHRASLGADAVDKALEASGMPETARVCGPLSGAGGVVTQHRRQLDLGAAGPLSEKQRAAIEGALEADVCRALGLPAGSVEDARIGADGAVTFGVRHRASLSADAVDKALEASGMPETARVCGSLSGAGGVVTQHRRQLDLGAAGPLSEKQRAAIEGALEADVCRALGLPAGSVEDARIGADGAVTFGVRHRASLGADAVDKALEASGMPETARVCGPLSGAGGVVTQHRRQLNLGAAGPLSEKQRAAIEGALEADVCRALGLPAGSVEDARIGADGAVTFGVRHRASLGADAVDKALEASGMPETARVCGPLSGAGGVVTQHRRQLDLGAAGPLSEKQRAAIEGALEADVCRALGLPAGSVEDARIGADGAVTFGVRHRASLGADAVDKALEASGMPETARVCGPLSGAGGVVTQHRRQLNLGAAGPLSEKQRAAIEGALEADVCRALGLPAGSVEDARIGADGAVTFGVRHRASLGADAVDKALEASGMPETARVCGPLSGAGGVVTQHRRQLNLGAAGPLSEKQRAAIEGALEADVCRALGLPAGSVEDARIGADGAVTFGVRHRASLGADAVDKALEASGMPETARVCGSLSGAGGVVTQHRRQLNLGAAGPLSEKQRAAIEGALEADVCRALGLPAGSVEDARIGADGAVTFGVRHRASLSADAVDKALEASGMPETARVCGPLSGAGGVVTQHRRQLDLGAAGPLSEKQRAAIEGALEADVCRALGLPAGSVEDARIGADGAVTFGVRHRASLGADAVDKALEASGMPETARVCGPLSGAGGVVTQHRRQLNLGAAGPLSEKQRAAIEGALEADVCRALGLPAGSVEDARIGADGAVTFGVRHRASLGADAVDKALEASGMPETARVCGSLSGAGGVVTQHRRQLNLGAAGPLSEKQRAAIEGALEADVCRALGLPAGSVEDARIGADGAVTFGVRHRASLGADAVDKALEASGMPETARVCGPLSGAGGVVTQHRRQLDLGAAGPLSEKQRAAIEGALEADVCRALGLPAGSVEDARIGADGAVTFGVRHRASLSADAVDKALEASGMPETARVCGPLSGAGGVVTQHRRQLTWVPRGRCRRSSELRSRARSRLTCAVHLDCRPGVLRMQGSVLTAR
ncbi:hypothetical protein ERJ75_001221100 [Trypanosoma vivax]|nr:hypothetical protein ERJ75_001221100 [Trypanosoma vivax]